MCALTNISTSSSIISSSIDNDGKGGLSQARRRPAADLDQCPPNTSVFSGSTTA
jgi:hypothetical protein